jgi:hypothetical protein
VVDSRKRLGQIWSYETYTIKANTGYHVSNRPIPGTGYVSTSALEGLSYLLQTSAMSSRRADRHHFDLPLCLDYDETIWA